MDPLGLGYSLWGKLLGLKNIPEKRKDLEFIVGKIGKNQDLDFVGFVDF